MQTYIKSLQISQPSNNTYSTDEKELLQKISSYYSVAKSCWWPQENIRVRASNFQKGEKIVLILPAYSRFQLGHTKGGKLEYVENYWEPKRMFVLFKSFQGRELNFIFRHILASQIHILFTVLPTPFEQKSALAWKKIGKIGKLNNFQNLLKYL